MNSLGTSDFRTTIGRSIILFLFLDARREKGKGGLRVGYAFKPCRRAQRAGKPSSRDLWPLPRLLDPRDLASPFGGERPG